MCCSGKRNNIKKSEVHGASTSNSRGQFHFPIMLCCIIPIVITATLSRFASDSSYGNILPIIMIGVCSLSHLFIRNRKYKEQDNCCNEKNQ